MDEKGFEGSRAQRVERDTLWLSALL